MTGWPWPLDGVQGWFEGLVETVSRALSPVIYGIRDTIIGVVKQVSWRVWEALPEWIRDGLLFLGELIGQAWTVLWDFVRDPIGSIQAGLDWVVSAVGDTLNVISTAIGDVAAGVWTALPDWVRGPLESLKDLAGQAWTTLWDFARDPIGSLQAGFNWVTTTVTSAFDGALSTFGGWITDAMAAVAGALGSALQGMITWLSTEIPKAVGVVFQFAKAHLVDPIVSGLQWLFGRLAEIVHGLISTVEGLFAHHSPITPEEALPLGIGAIAAVVGAGALATGLVDVLSTKVGATGASLIGIGGYITEVINPGMFMGAVLGVLVGVGIKTPITHYYNRLFKPNIPGITEAQRMMWRGKLSMGQFLDVVALSGYGGPYEEGYVALTQEIPGKGDLVRYVVREVIDVDTFYENMAYQGFSLFWAQAEWEAHWRLPSPGDLVDSMHRGDITRVEYDQFVVLHDYKPEPRPGIAISDQTIMSRLTKRLIPRVDLRRGYRIGRLSRADLDERYGWLGYEEDSELQTDIQVGLAFEAERNKLRDNAKADLVKGYITEDILRADLAVLDFSAEAVDYHVADAMADRDRKHKDKLLDVFEDAYQKDLKTYEELEADAATVIVDADALDLFLTEAWIRKFKKPKAD